MKVFLSHAQETKEIVKMIRSCLPAHVEVWLDAYDLDLGEELVAKIKTAIFDEIDYFIVFLGKDSLRSTWVDQEVGWALEKENVLRRTFMLPVLLDDVWGDYESREGFGERLYLECFDWSDEAVVKTGMSLKEHLFSLVSRLIVETRLPTRKAFLDEMKRDIGRFKDVAFLLHGALSERTYTIGTNQLAFDRVVAAMEAYNDYSSGFIDKLPDYAARVKNLWANNFIGNQTSNLTDYIENDVFRTQMFATNEMRNVLNRFTTGVTPDEEESAKYDVEKDVVLANILSALEEMSRRTNTLVSMLESDL